MHFTEVISDIMKKSAIILIRIFIRAFKWRLYTITLRATFLILSKNYLSRFHFPLRNKSRPRTNFTEFTQTDEKGY